MNQEKVGKYWDENATNWTKLARMGCDLYRDHVNMPAFLAMLPEVKGLYGLDIGCGEGENTRRIAERGAKIVAIDISPIFIKQAQVLEKEKPLGIEYEVASALELPFKDQTFDFAIATMSFMDIPEIEKVIQQAYRILKPNGFLQFSISHPCFSTPMWKWIYNDDGQKAALQCGKYFQEQNGEIDEWIFSRLPGNLKNTIPNFKVPRFTRPLSVWLNLLIEAGFTFEQFGEPKATDETVENFPYLADTQIIAYFLIVRCRKKEN